MIFNPSFDTLSNYNLEIDTEILYFDLSDGTAIEQNNTIHTYGKKKLRQK